MISPWRLDARRCHWTCPSCRSHVRTCSADVGSLPHVPAVQPRWCGRLPGFFWAARRMLLARDGVLASGTAHDAALNGAHASRAHQQRPRLVQPPAFAVPAAGRVAGGDRRRPRNDERPQAAGAGCGKDGGRAGGDARVAAPLAPARGAPERSRLPSAPPRQAAAAFRARAIQAVARPRSAARPDRSAPARVRRGRHRIRATRRDRAPGACSQQRAGAASIAAARVRLMTVGAARAAAVQSRPCPTAGPRPARLTSWLQIVGDGHAFATRYQPQPRQARRAADRCRCPRPATVGDNSASELIESPLPAGHDPLDPHDFGDGGGGGGAEAFRRRPARK